MAVSERWTLLPSNARSEEAPRWYFTSPETLDVVRLERPALEFVEDGTQWLRHDVAKHVQTAAMGHSEHDFLDAELTASLDDLFQCRRHRLAAFEPEPLGSGVLDLGELFEALSLDQFVQDGLLALGREPDVFLFAFDALLDPRLLCWRSDVHEFDADLAAVRAPQNSQDLPHGRGF